MGKHWTVVVALTLSLGAYMHFDTAFAHTETEKRGSCPPRMFPLHPCIPLCSSDRDCPDDEKCCYNECAQCVKPLVSIEKPGDCPPPTGMGACGLLCSNDESCPDNEKCCYNGCGQQCMAPDTGETGSCPPPLTIPVPTHPVVCLHNNMCPGKMLCCRTTRGPICVDPRN